MSEGSSYRQILRSSWIIGGASVANILIGLARAKIAAVLLGPAGIGLIGLFTNLVATASVVAGLGFGSVGTRQIAEASGRQDTNGVAAARRALFFGTLILAVLGGIVFWSLRNLLAIHVLGDVTFSSEIGWLAIAVALTVASASQGALLNGLRRIGDMARVSVITAVFSTVAGILAIFWFGRAGVVAFVIATPFASFVIGHVYVLRLPKLSVGPTSIGQLSDQWRTFTRLGATFMLASLVGTVGQLAVRTIVQRELGIDALGHFQATWAISMTYIGFVLGAMGTDYYPRLTAVMNDHSSVNRMVNEQSEVALLLAGPAFLAMVGLAPWIIETMYSKQFDPSAELLRWQVLGDILKVASWPLGFVLLAAGDGRAFLVTEALAMLVFSSISYFLLPVVGLNAVAIAFVGLYAFYLPTVHFLARRRTGFRWSQPVRIQLLLVLTTATIVAIVASYSAAMGMVLGCVIATALGVHAVHKLVRRASDNATGESFSRKLISIYRRIVQRKES